MDDNKRQEAAYNDTQAANETRREDATNNDTLSDIEGEQSDEGVATGSNDAGVSNPSTPSPDGAFDGERSESLEGSDPM